MKVLWFNEYRPNDKPEQFSMERSRENDGENGYVFLFFREEQLLVAGHCSLRCKVLADTAKAHIPSRNPDGAGYINHGRIVEGFSTHFRVDTSDEDRVVIEQSLGIKK